jgi:branched-subunit amino acid aminotransferase/4-amino-4-deoxychorismate lyase
LLGAEAIIVLNSVRGITPVREIRDRHDQVLLTALASQVHPIVVSLRHQWADALQATACT